MGISGMEKLKKSLQIKGSFIKVDSNFGFNFMVYNTPIYMAQCCYLKKMIPKLDG